LVFIKEIYEYYILNTTLTFRTKALDLEALEKIYPLNQKNIKHSLSIQIRKWLDIVHMVRIKIMKGMTGPQKIVFI
jgi:hypothetical protein